MANERISRAESARRRRAHQRKQFLALGTILATIIIVATIIISSVGADYEEVLVSPEPEPTPEPLPTQTYTIVVDSGHSFQYGGAVGIEYQGETVLEENITAETSQYLFELLEADPNFEVYLTHPYEDHLDIVGRRMYAATLNPDFLISIHANGNDTTNDLSGFEIYAQVPEHPYHEESLEMAQYIIDGFTAAGHIPRKGTGLFYMRYVLYSDGSGYDTYTLTPEEEEIYDFTGADTLGIIEHEDFPALLVEQGYVTSLWDVENWLTGDGCEKSAQIYYQAICQYFGVT